MSKLTKIASAMPFAHFLGLPSAAASSPAASASAEDEDRKQRDGESDDDYAKRMEEPDKKDEEARKAEQDEKDKEAKRADQDDDSDADAAADAGDDKEEGKRAGRAQGARQRERIRCAAIVAAGMKYGQAKQACAFAFDTNMTAAQAMSALAIGATERPTAVVEQPAPVTARRPSLDERMSHARPANPGNSAPAAAEPDAADRILAASKRRQSEQ